MEVQDIPAIVASAHARNVKVVLDNTWAAGVLFDAFAHGVDVTMQAITKYIGGHSDLLLGSVTVRDDSLYRRLGDAQQVIGCAVSPDDCSLALRGLQTLAVRLSAIENSALAIAKWLAERPAVERALHPPLPRPRILEARFPRLFRRVFAGLQARPHAGAGLRFR